MSEGPPKVHYPEEVESMWGTKKARPVSEPLTADQLRVRRAQAQRAQKGREQSAFDQWMVGTVYPRVEFYLDAWSKGQVPFEMVASGGPVSVCVNDTRTGVQVTSYDPRVAPALEQCYRARNFAVSTRVQTEMHDRDRPGKMEPLVEPAYITTITC
jgi:hypothetical protein